jgi:hypothetical protein
MSSHTCPKGKFAFVILIFICGSVLLWVPFSFGGVVVGGGVVAFVCETFWSERKEYQLNLDLNLAMQLIGGGGADYALIASMLNLCCTKRQLKDSFTSNEETIGLHTINMAAKVVETNLSDEKLASELVDDPISVSAHLLADRKRKEKVVVIETPTNLGVGDESDDVITTVPT